MGGTDHSEGQMWQGSSRFARLPFRQGLQSAECWWSSKFKGCPPDLPCERWFMAREQARESQQGQAASPTALPGASVKLPVTPGRTPPWSQTNRGSVTRADLEKSFCGMLLPVQEVGGIQI